MHHFAEKLTPLSWLVRIWPRLRRDASTSGAPGSIRFSYVDATPLAERLALRMGATLGVAVERMDFDAAEIFDADGLLVWLRIYYRDLAQALALISAHPEFPASDPSLGDAPNFAMFLRKQCVPGPTLFAGEGVWRSLYLIQVFARKSAGSKATLWLRNHPWLGALDAYARSFGNMAIQPCGRAYRPILIVARLLGRDLRSIAERWLPARTAAAEPAPAGRSTACATPGIALQYYGHFNLDAPEQHSDFFFWQQSELTGRQVVALFPFPQDRLDAARGGQLARHGIRAIALRRAATTLGARFVYTRTSLLRNVLRAATVVAGALGDARRAWAVGQRRLFESEVEYWERLLENCNARVFLTWFKYTSAHGAIAEAVHRRDGVLAIYQRSYEGNPSAQTAVVADLMFGFAPAGAAVEARSGSRIRHYVATGYLGDHRFPLAQPAASRLREALRLRGARFVVAFFDESSFLDPRWGVGVERSRRHYRFLLDQVITDASLGLVLKPKTPRTLRIRLGGMGELLDRALATGRCHIFDEGVLQGSAPPVQAALAADVAIHESVASGTAAMEAALAGVRTLLMDDDGWTMSPLYRLGSERVIFRDWDALWEAVGTMRSGERRSGLGDWSSLLDELDPFRDGRGAERMGNYLQWLVDDFAAGATRDAALERATERYRREWGQDKVLSVLPRPEVPQPA